MAYALSTDQWLLGFTFLNTVSRCACPASFAFTFCGTILACPGRKNSWLLVKTLSGVLSPNILSFSLDLISQEISYSTHLICRTWQFVAFERFVNCIKSLFTIVITREGFNIWFITLFKALLFKLWEVQGYIYFLHKHFLLR